MFYKTTIRHSNSLTRILSIRHRDNPDYGPCFTRPCNLLTKILSIKTQRAVWLHKGSHQGWTQTSPYLQLIHFTSHHTTSHVFFVFFCFLTYLYSAGTQHGNLHEAGWPISFCRPTLEPVLATANTGKNWERFWEKCRWMDQKARNKQGRNTWQ